MWCSAGAAVCGGVNGTHPTPTLTGGTLGRVRILLVTNPAARKTKPHLTRWVADRLSDVAKVTVVATTHRHHATEIARDAAADHFDAVIALGGDGTVNEVLQGIAGTPTGLGVLPGGSTNVFGRILGIPRSLTGATSILYQALREGRSRQVPAGRANDRWFAWCAGFGYDADVVREVEWHPLMKRYLGQLSFLIHGWEARRRAELVRISITAGPPRPSTRPRNAPSFVEATGAAVVCNADPYTFFGPFASRMCPEATLERGLDLSAMTDVSLPAMLQTMRKALSGRDVRDLPWIEAWHDREWFELATDRAIPVHTDGDPAGSTSHLRVEWVPDAMRLVM